MKDSDETKDGPINGTVVLVIGVFCTIYLLNPFFGVDLIPDNLPIIGNLDEAAAVAVLISCLTYFGFDVSKFTNMFKNVKKEDGTPIIDIESKKVD